MADFTIGTISVHTIFKELEINLTIPEYQRPYIWTDEHIQELLNDWRDHFFDNQYYNSKSIQYFMGNIMIHNKNGTYEVIDGQQRLTTLLIMDYIWNPTNAALNKGKLNFNYNSKLSENHIKKNRNYLKSLLGEGIDQHFQDIIKKLVFSVIITTSEDDAFVFFESQNNRGVSLDEIDYFKSYHLRELKNNEVYLKYFAKKFDQLNASSNTNDGIKPYLKTLNGLFEMQLWLSRNWTKGEFGYADRKKLLETFQKKTIAFNTVDDIKIYPSYRHTSHMSLVFDLNIQTHLNSTIDLQSKEAIDIPFIINQPIQKGIGFFLYTEKYNALFNQLFKEEKVEQVKAITTLIYSVYNNHFINLYQLGTLMYYDKFGDEKIEAFCKWFEHFMGAFRMNRGSISAQSSIVLLREHGNVLQYIEQSYLPEEVIEFVQDRTKEDFYTGFVYKENENKKNDGTIYIYSKEDKILKPARQDYYQRVKHFYSEQLNDNIELTEKKNWIYASLIK